MLSQWENQGRYGFSKKKTNKLSKWRDLLPPMPEDYIILTGDIFSLFVYCFMDHATDDMFSEDSMLHALAASSSKGITLPVWSDVSSNFGSSLLREIMNQQQIAHLKLMLHEKLSAARKHE